MCVFYLSFYRTKVKKLFYPCNIFLILQRINCERKYKKVNKVEKFKSLLSDSEKIVLVSHVNPDGDAIGSLTGMKYFLELNGKIAQVIVPNRFPEFLGYLDPDKSVITYEGNEEVADKHISNADMVICMDFNSLKRIDALGASIGNAAAPKVLIDHHLQPDNIFEVIFSDVQASSTCEVAYYLLKELCAISPELKPLTLKSGISFYTGLMTDTNNFANSVRPQTFQMACELLE